jgi:hypothetical protein
MKQDLTQRHPARQYRARIPTDLTALRQRQRLITNAILKHNYLILATTFFAPQIGIKSNQIVTGRNVTFASGRLGSTLGK